MFFGCCQDNIVQEKMINIDAEGIQIIWGWITDGHMFCNVYFQFEVCIPVQVEMGIYIKRNILVFRRSEILAKILYEI